MSAPRGLTEAQVLVVGRGLLTELARLHETGAVNGAIGPSTVLVDGRGGVRLVPGPADHAYASPEVLSGQPPTMRSDLYSAGALLAHLFRGEHRWPPTAADLDPGVAWLLGPVLAAEPEARPRSASAMVTAVDQLAEQRHGPDWRAAAGIAGAAGVGGAVPVLVLATGGTASAPGTVAGAGVGGAAASHAVGSGISKGLAVKIGAVVAASAVAVAGTAAAVILLTDSETTGSETTGSETTGGETTGSETTGGETTGGETKTMEVPATSDIYLAGATEEMEAQLSEPGTRPVSVGVDGAGKVSFPSVEGDLSACSACEPESPDGGSISFGSTGITGFNGIAGVTFANRTLFVVGVFVGDDHPTHPEDAVVDLSGADEDATQQPELGEPFFIGDGETGGGKPQEVVVPEDAKTLYLGFADAYGFIGVPGAYGDNTGSVDIEVAID